MQWDSSDSCHSCDISYISYISDSSDSCDGSDSSDSSDKAIKFCHKFFFFKFFLRLNFFFFRKLWQLQNSKCDKTQKIKLWQN